MKIGVTIAGTHSYQYALADCVKRVKKAIYHAQTRRPEIEAVFILSTDAEGVDYARQVCPEANVEVTHMEEGGVRYKDQAQLLIADLQQRGFDRAVAEDVDLCWTVESDVLVPYNALSCMLDMLQFDDGYYDVAFVTYPSQSGSAFLGGHGSPSNPISEDFLVEERDVPEELLDKYNKAKEQVEKPDAEEDAKKAWADVNEEVKKCPPRDNVFGLNAKQWRRRGWFDNAFPGIGRGAVLETDWTGLGCNLLTRKALALASFDGYEGKGTQDLFLNWRRWKANDLRMCVISHCVCEHVITKEDGTRWVALAHHEPQGECKGHLRIQLVPYKPEPFKIENKPA